MTRSFRVLTALFVCLLLCVVLFPAAFADGNTVEAFQTAIANREPSFTLTGDMEIPDGSFINASGTALIVPSGKKLIVSGGISELSDLQLKGGTVEIRGGIFHVNGSFSHTGGTVQVFGGSNYFPVFDVWPDKTGVFTFPEGKGEVALHSSVKTDRELVDALDGANDLPEHFIADISVEGNCILRGKRALEKKTELHINGGKNGYLTIEAGAVLEYRGGGNVFLENRNTGVAVATIKGTLIANHVSVDPNCTFVISDGGSLITHAFTDNGSVTVMENGLLYAENEILFGENTTLNLNGTLSVEHEAVPSIDALRAKISFGSNSLLDISYNMKTEADIRTELSKSVNYPHFRRSVWALFDWTTTRNITVPGNVRVCIPGDSYGGLVIPGGKRFIINQGGELMARGLRYGSSVVTLDGSLVNNGVINLFWGNDSAGEIAMGETGTYSGSGQIFRDNKPYTIQPYNEEFVALKAAINDYRAGEGPNEYDLRNKGNISLAGDLLIPSGFTVRAAGTVVTVPQGTALLIEGTLNCDSFVNNNVINVRGRGRLNVWRTDSVFNGMINCMDEGVCNLPEPSAEALEHFHLEGNGRLSLQFGANSSNLESVKAACDDLAEPGRIECVIHLFEDMTLSKSMTFDKSSLYLENVSLTVPRGITLRASVELMTSSLIVKAGGSFVNTGTVRLRAINGPDAPVEEIGRIIVESGGSCSGGKIIVSGTDNPDAQLQGVNLSDFSKFARSGSETVYTYIADIYTRFVDALNDENVHSFELKELGRFVLRDCAALNLRDRDDFYIETWGTTLVVPANQTLTIPANIRFHVHSLEVEKKAFVEVEENAELNLYTGFTLDGRIFAEHGARLYLPIYNTGSLSKDRITLAEGAGVGYQYHPADDAGLRRMKLEADALESPYHANFQVTFPWEPTEDITFDNSVGFDIKGENDKNGSLTIDDGVTVTLSSWGNAHCADITVLAGGTLVNNSNLSFSGESAEMPTGVLRVEEGGRYTGVGSIHISAGDDHDSHIIGIDGLDKEELNGETVYRLTGEVLQALYGAAEGGSDYFNLRDCGRLVLPRDLTIPASLRVEGWGTTLVVPEGITVDVAGTLELEGMELSGLLNVSKARPEDGFWANANISDHMTLNGTINLGIDAQAHFPGADVRDSLDRIHFYSEYYHAVCLHYFTENADEVYALQADTESLPENFSRCIHILFPWTLDRDVVFSSSTGLNIEGAWEDGSVTVPAGKKLTIGTYCNINNATMTVAGELFNSGSIEFQCDYGSRDPHFGVLEIADGGIYSGGGVLRLPYDCADHGRQVVGLDLFDENSFRVFDEGWCAAYVYIGGDWRDAELILPASLNEIQSEAFAGGTFRSVYIPESVHYIDDSAFDGIDGLTIYGHYDTEAYYFADRHGILFIAVP